MYALRSVALIALFCLLMITNTGCFTLMGAVVGASVDANRGEQYETVPGWQTKAPKPGKPVTLTLRDSTRVSGTYVGLATRNPDTYAQRYAAWQTQPEGAAFPAIGERITVVRSFGRRTAVEFQGFDYGQEEGARDPHLYLLAKRPGQDKLERVKLKKGLWMTDSLGTPMVTDSLKTMLINGRLPILSTITLILTDTVRVEIERVASLTGVSAKPGRGVSQRHDDWIRALKTGTPVTLRLRDSTLVTGVFAGHETLTPEVYAKRYAAWQAHPKGSAFPELGERITIVWDSGYRADCTFQGFGYRRSLQHLLRPCILAKHDRGIMEAVDLESVREITGDWTAGISADTLKTMFTERRLPLASATLLVTRLRVEVDIERIAFLPSKKENQSSWMGALATTGVGLDLMVGAVLLGVLASSLVGPL